MREVICHGVIRAFAVVASMVLLYSAASCRAPTIIVPVVSVSTQTWSGEGLSGRLLSTEHFDIVSTLQDAQLEAALPGFLEAAYRQYTQIIPPGKAQGRRLTTYIFGTRREWNHFTKRRFTSRHKVYARIMSGGFTEGTTSVSFFRSRSSTLSTLAHEGWHQYSAACVSTPMPAWLDEGLACYNEAVDFAGPVPRFTPQHNTFRLGNLRKIVKSGELLTIGEIIDTNAGEIIAHNHSEVALGYYAQVWALVTFLKHGADGRYADGLQRMLNHITDGSFQVRVGAARLTAAGDTGESAAQSAFRTYFSESVTDVGKAYRDYMMRVVGFRTSETATSQ